MEQFDLLIVLVLALGFIIGAFKGFIKQFVSIICIIVGTVAGRALAPSAAALFDKDYSNIAYGISFAIIFLIVVIIGIVISKAVKAILHSADLGWVNRLAGGALCAFKYLIIIGLFINLVEILGADHKLFPKDIRDKSLFYNMSKKSLGCLMPFFEHVSNTTHELIDKSGLEEFTENL